MYIHIHIGVDQQDTHRYILLIENDEFGWIVNAIANMTILSNKAFGTGIRYYTTAHEL